MASWPAGQRVLVPHRALAELQRILSAAEQLTVRLGARHATFECGHVRLTTRLIEGDYPELPQPRAGHERQRAHGRQGGAARVVAPREDHGPARYLVGGAPALGGDTLTLSVRDQDYGAVVEEVDVQYDGTEMLVGFNPDYLMAGVDAIDADEVTFGLRDPVKAVVLRGVEPRRLPVPADAAARLVGD